MSRWQDNPPHDCVSLDLSHYLPHFRLRLKEVSLMFHSRILPMQP